MAAVELDRVTKTFAGGVVAVDDVTLSISDGEFIVLVGPSGCGKSTLLRLIAGLEEVTSGRISIADRDVTSLPARKRDLAMVFQNYALYPHMTVRQNLGYGLRVRRVPKAEISSRVADVASLLGLEELLDRKPGQLSGGQRQRVAMGRAIVREPKAYLMDEPLSNLDAKLRVGMRASLAQLHVRLGVTSVYVTHDQTEAMTLGQRVAVMHDGRIVQVDTPQRLYQSPRDLFVGTFIGSPAMNVVDATIVQDEIRFAGFCVPLHDVRRPPSGLEHVVLGIRPESFDDAAFAPAALPRIEVRADVLEDLGSDAYVFFRLDAARAQPPASLAPADAEEAGLLADDSILFAARINPRAAVRADERMQLAVNPEQFYFFDRETGENLLRESPPQEHPTAT
jgi:multiple sugar transport system ATP-binding protein